MMLPSYLLYAIPLNNWTDSNLLHFIPPTTSCYPSIALNSLNFTELPLHYCTNVIQGGRTTLLFYHVLETVKIVIKFQFIWQTLPDHKFHSLKAFGTKSYLIWSKMALTVKITRGIFRKSWTKNSTWWCKKKFTSKMANIFMQGNVMKTNKVSACSCKAPLSLGRCLVSLRYCPKKRLQKCGNSLISWTILAFQSIFLKAWNKA